MSILRYRLEATANEKEYKEEILGGDFLMCIGGRGPFMKKLRNKTDDLYQSLVSFKEKNKE